MPFIRIAGVTGKVYSPEPCDKSWKKHDCEDCFSCQMCSDDRCRLCRCENKETQIKDKKNKTQKQKG